MEKSLKILISLVLIFDFLGVIGQNSDSLKLASYTKQAEIFLSDNDFEKSREYALKAIEINPNCGEAYILIGSAYIKSVDLCADDYFSKSMIFCLALEKFEKARELDKSVSGKAELLIKVYSEYLPDRETVFTEADEGDKYKVECWIKEVTRLKFKNK